mmetsp:Transcript_75826/g.214379  ORF Transcript_75826/g.214379 Transcript_75826/m.214379 type:complete len:524 (+) Transcript_75826:1467-3038(+)
MRRLPRCHRSGPLLLEVRLHTVAVGHRVEHARPPHDPGCPRRPLHRAVGTEVVGRGAHRRVAVPLAVDDVHERLRVVVEGLAQGSLLQLLLPRRPALLEVEPPHVVRLRRGEGGVLQVPQRHARQRLRASEAGAETRDVVVRVLLLRCRCHVEQRAGGLRRGDRGGGSRADRAQGLLREGVPRGLLALHPVVGLAADGGQLPHDRHAVLGGGGRTAAAAAGGTGAAAPEAGDGRQARRPGAAAARVGCRGRLAHPAAPCAAGPSTHLCGPPLLEHRLAVLPERDGKRVVRAQESLRDLVACLERCCRLVPLLQELTLHGDVVVCDGEHGIVVLLHHRVRLRDALAHQLERAEGVLHRLVVLLELGEDRAQVEVGPRQGRAVGLQLDLHLQRAAEVAQGPVELADLLVVAAQVVAGHGEQTGVVGLHLVREEDRLRVLELLERRLQLAPLEALHPVLVAPQDEVADAAAHGPEHLRADCFRLAAGAQRLRVAGPCFGPISHRCHGACRGSTPLCLLPPPAWMFS